MVALGRGQHPGANWPQHSDITSLTVSMDTVEVGWDGVWGLGVVNMFLPISISFWSELLLTPCLHLWYTTLVLAGFSYRPGRFSSRTSSTDSAQGQKGIYKSDKIDKRDKSDKSNKTELTKVTKVTKGNWQKWQKWQKWNDKSYFVTFLLFCGQNVILYTKWHFDKRRPIGLGRESARLTKHQQHVTFGPAHSWIMY